jgi:RNA polymerase sigma-70 factor (ECF subfamily)
MDDEIRAHLESRRYTEAFELVLAQYRDKVYRLAYSILGNPASADDAAQQVFIRIWRALPGFERRASISTWVFTITRNTCLTAAKRNAAQRTISLDSSEVRFAAESRHARAREDRGEPDLSHLISQLPEKYRQVIVLFHMEERSYEEVARLLDLPMGTVKTYLHRARKQLAAAIMGAEITAGGR